MSTIHQGLSTALMILILVAAVVWGFVIVGSPNAARQRRFDERRIDDLRAIHAAIQRMVVEKEDGKAKLRRPLPRELVDVAAFVRSEPGHNALSLEDLETGESYQYRVRGNSDYELCAVFLRAREEKHDPFWNHPSGLHCFTFDALKITE